VDAAQGGAAVQLAIPSPPSHLQRRTAEADPALLPSGLRSYGKPLSVHRPWQTALADAQARFFARLFGTKAGDARSGPRFGRLVLFGLAGLVFLGGLCFVWAYFYRPPKNEDPRFLLLAAGATFVFAIVLAVCGIFYRPKGGKGGTASRPFNSDKDVPDLYLVYPHGLAAVAGNTFGIHDLERGQGNRVGLEEHESSAPHQKRRRSASAGLEWIHRDGRAKAVDLSASERGLVTQSVDPDCGREIGKVWSLRPAPIGSQIQRSQDELEQRRLDETHQPPRQRPADDYTQDRMLSWCWCEVDRIPNWNTFYDALCRTAPEDPGDSNETPLVNCAWLSLSAFVFAGTTSHNARGYVLRRQFLDPSNASFSALFVEQVVERRRRITAPTQELACERIPVVWAKRRLQPVFLHTSLYVQPLPFSGREVVPANFTAVLVFQGSPSAAPGPRFGLAAWTVRQHDYPVQYGHYGRLHINVQGKLPANRGIKGHQEMGQVFVVVVRFERPHVEQVLQGIVLLW
jgi:hypothetical protein